jgi:hypothetical protein
MTDWGRVLATEIAQKIVNQVRRNDLFARLFVAFLEALD